MQIVRTVVWVLLTIVLVAFVAINWAKVPVNLWPIDNGSYLHFEWPVGFVAIVFFVLGMLPTWLLAKTGKWRLNRRINALENSVRANAAPAPIPMAPLATSSQLEAATPPESPTV